MVKADLTEEGSFDGAIMGCEGVFHTASPVLPTPNVCIYNFHLQLYSSSSPRSLSEKSWIIYSFISLVNKATSSINKS